jgi:hypothetical protein
MSLEHRIENLERQLDDTQPGKPFIIVDDEEGPSDQAERETWIRSKVPAGVTDAVVVRIVYDDAESTMADLGDDDDD